MKKSQHRKKGFTLIELLVVITIIGILAGIAISSFGGIFGAAGQLAAEDSLHSIYKGLVQKYKGQVKFPKGEALDEESPAGFAVWFRNKTRNTESGLWYIDEDDKALALTEDEDAAGIPSTMPTDVGDLDDDQKNAMAWSIAIPGEDANPKLEQNLRSGPFPIMWTRGHEGDQGTWDPDSPWSGDGGHVLFSNGKVEFYEDTKGADESGVFNIASKDDDDDDAEIEQTADPEQALPEDWQVILIDDSISFSSSDKKRFCRHLAFWQARQSQGSCRIFRTRTHSPCKGSLIHGSPW